MRYAAVAKLAGWRVPHAPIRPAYLSGCIWAVGWREGLGSRRLDTVILPLKLGLRPVRAFGGCFRRGFTFMINGIASLGFSIGYTCPD